MVNTEVPLPRASPSGYACLPFLESLDRGRTVTKADTATPGMASPLALDPSDTRMFKASPPWAGFRGDPDASTKLSTSVSSTAQWG